MPPDTKLHHHVIRPLCVAQVELFKATQTYYTDFDKIIEIPIFVWVLEGPSRKIVVDAGWKPDAQGLRSIRGAPRIVGGGAEPVVSGLLHLGINPEDVDILILTHLHGDHCSNFELFKNARVYLQKEELDHALNPISNQSLMYHSEIVQRIANLSNLELLEGDVEVAPGVRLIRAPGHTPGLQAVAVETEMGIAVICSDAVPLYHNWYPNNPKYGTMQPHLKHIAPGIIYNLNDCYETFDKIESMGKIIIPSHDSEVKKLKRIP